MKKIIFLSICLLISGCASKPRGGGWVVGNPVAPEGISSQTMMADMNEHCGKCSEEKCKEHQNSMKDQRNSSSTCPAVKACSAKTDCSCGHQHK